MKKLLNTLYVTSPDRYLSLDGENIVVKDTDTEIGRVPLHNLQAVVTFGYAGVSPALMGACVKRDIDLCFLSGSGRFLARVTGEVKGNVTLRKEQFRLSDKPDTCLNISKNMIFGKVYNSRWILKRAIRDYPMRVDTEKIQKVTEEMQQSLGYIRICESAPALLGYEGEAASTYFSAFDELILQQKDVFSFTGRSRRPPLDEINAMLSFAYSLLNNICAAALQTVGLDPYVGVYHTMRPGRMSLALDLMEELRSVFADRFVLTMINKRIISGKGFIKKENGACVMADDTRKLFLSQWQEKKKEAFTHPFLKEKMEWGMLPHAQALLLARFIRGDLDEYPPFLWK